MRGAQTHQWPACEGDLTNPLLKLNKVSLLFFVDLITYPCPKLDAGLDIRCM